MAGSHRFLDVSGQAWPDPQPWPALVVPRADIEREIERLADEPVPANGRRASLVVHPRSTAPGLGLTPGIAVSIEVLKPGEASVPTRRNSTLFDFCIRGSGSVTIGDQRFAVAKFDAWNTPSMHVYAVRNDGADLLVRLSYSNAPLLEKLQVHYVEEDPPEAGFLSADEQATSRTAARRARDAAERIVLESPGAELLGYEYLIDIDMPESRALLWPWAEVAPQLGKVRDIGERYTGRRLYVLYNPATGARIGATHSFFATISSYPAGILDQPHRHLSAAINYYFQGHGKSDVMGEKFEWEAGDLMFSAPGWAVHHHGSRHDGFLSLTVQDHPLHIAMESLIWQETLDAPIRNLGNQPGFATNRAEFAAAR